jgi:cytoskeleton protein RodZ
MSEEIIEQIEDIDLEIPPAQTAGQILRAAREAAGLHIAVLAVSLKVSVKKIEALEADRYEDLLDTVFIRALASSVSRHLKIDPVPVLALLPQTAKPRLEIESSAINTPFQTASEQALEPIWNQISKPALLVALVLLVGALVLILFPAAETPKVPVIAQSAADTGETPTALGSSASDPLTKSVVVVETVVNNHVGALSAATPALNTALPPIQGRPATSGLLVFSARAPAWVEVTDAAGVVQIRRNIAQGEVVGVSGQQPLAVVVGRADMTDVQVFGKPFPLDALSKGNVARFEVK